MHRHFGLSRDFQDLPFQNIRILPFNIFHGKEAGRFARTLYSARANKQLHVPDSLIIPNDSKLFAQGSVEKDIRYFVTADVESKKVIDTLRVECSAGIEHLDINLQPTTGVWLGIIPFTSPLCMMARLPFGVPFWQTAVSLVVLYASFMFLIWLCAKIYRAGIFMYGKKPSLIEIIRLARYK